jgi:hypothetical protein
MIHKGLSLYLALVLLAGPWYCCCTVLRWHSHPAPQAHAQSAAPTPESNDCCHCAHHDTPAETTPTPAKPTHQPERPHCPCSERQGQQAALSPADALSAKLTQLHPIAWESSQPAHSLTVPVVVSLVGTTRTPRECLAFPFATAQDILRTLQTFRC